MHKYSLLSWSTITALSLFWYDAKSFALQHLAIICHSSQKRLDEADAHFQVSPEIFDWVQAQAVTGPLKDIHRVVCLGSLSCWKVNLLSSLTLRCWMLWTGFSLRLSLYFGALSFSSTLMSLSVPAAENSSTAWAATSTLYFWDGTLHVMSSACFPSNMMLGIEVH